MKLPKPHVDKTVVLTTSKRLVAGAAGYAALSVSKRGLEHLLAPGNVREQVICYVGVAVISSLVGDLVTKHVENSIQVFIDSFDKTVENDAD